MVELMCNGTFEDKDPNEAMEYLDLLAENAQNWDTTGTYEAPGKTQPHTSSGGMYNLREDHDLQAMFASLARKVEALELKRSGQLKYVQDIVCQICEANEHSTNNCPTLPSFKECLHEQAHALNSFKGPIIQLTSMWFNPGLAGLFITSTLLHLKEDINYLVVSHTLSLMNLIPIFLVFVFLCYRSLKMNFPMKFQVDCHLYRE
jgi:hypothetical protein